ncbi:hypothetical protein [Paenibacillus lemnae]|uniref:Uncharacterized protein n=1 Tax=Paenibacillus lemnae TaxID=1330551 RepID=A0A848MB85_PAELE|nr:hypothetical protein [Paenibacillus lemnae]NMO97451.1 hypothetical protein [Paenibacillus lemnae]
MNRKTIGDLLGKIQVTTYKINQMLNRTAFVTLSNCRDLVDLEVRIVEDQREIYFKAVQVIVTKETAFELRKILKQLKQLTTIK